MIDRSPLSEEDISLAAEYALGVLQGPDRQAFAKRLAQEPALAAEVRRWDEDFAVLASGIAPAAPSSQAWTGIENRLFARQQEDLKPSMWNSLGFWRSLALLSLAGVIGLGTWTLRPIPPAQDPTSVIAQVQNEATKLKLAVAYDAESGELRLNRLQGEPVAGRSYELWLIAGNDAPVSLGVLPVATTSRIKLPDALRNKLVGSVLAVSDEPQGGSPTGAPTGAVLATGELTKV
jgi:anti-sigma-K factor RskA